MNKRHLDIIYILVLAMISKFILADHILRSDEGFSQAIKILVIGIMFLVGMFITFRKISTVIEETTDVLRKKTGLAGGFLQALGTAFPDMVLGVVAAFLSLQARSTDYARSINLAIVAASTTFGSNIYNIAHAAWCIFRQNVADKSAKAIEMFPGLKFGGIVSPIKNHKRRPSAIAIDTAINILTALTILTSITAIAMVVFGKIDLGSQKIEIEGDLYQLIRPAGIGLLVLCIATLYIFRKGEQHSLEQRAEGEAEAEPDEENPYEKQPNIVIWIHLIIAGLAILLAAESLITAVEIFAEITHLPFVVTGILAGLIGCFGEMLVVHNFSVNPKGRIGDAIVGVAMDNIVTTLGASLVAILGGIFLGGNSLILIFVVILMLNTVLIQQIGQLKNTLAKF